MCVVVLFLFFCEEGGGGHEAVEGEGGCGETVALETICKLA